jgi:RNA polymerase sigma-70 factor (ECF subfamily)
VRISIRTDQRQTSADQELISKEMSRCVQGFIEKLPADYKMVILLSELEDFSNKEIAEILDVSLETVKIRLHRARARLKKLLQENCTFYRNERNVLACDVKTAFDKYKESN